MLGKDYFFTSESVTEGHPDKIADQISDAVLDSIIGKDPFARVACEALVTTGLAFVAGEITTNCYVEIPDIVRETIKNKEIHFIINTVSGSQAQKDSFSIRQSAIQYRVPFTTTISGATAVVNAIEKLKTREIHIKSIQEYHAP